jgi:hypothetical protein
MPHIIISRTCTKEFFSCDNDSVKQEKAMSNLKNRSGHNSRNLLHNHPLMRRCAVHEKSVKTKRRLAKINLRREWPVQIVFG